MHAINGTNITLTRGDSLFLQVHLKKDGEDYTPSEGSSVRFAMKEKFTDPEVILMKEIPISTMMLELKPEDTKHLKMGNLYKYDMQLTDEAGHVDTFLSGLFKIDNEVD